MNVAIDSTCAFFYKGSGIGNYTYQLIKQIKKLSPIDLCINSPIEKYQSFWEMVNKPINLYKNYSIFLNPHNGIGLPEKNAEKIITTLHDIIPSKLPETVSDSYLKIYNNKISSILEKSSLILTVSNFSKKDICETFNVKENKVHVTYLAPSEIYYPMNKNYCKKFLYKNYKIDFKYVLYIGSFSPRKNILGLIESFYLIHRKHPHIKLLIIGKKGKSYETYLNKVLKLKLENKIIFTDFIKTTDLPYFYNGSECFIYPSFYEGFGLPPLEAMACGIPVITSNVTSLPEILKDVPIYINPHNTNEMCEKLHNLLNNKPLQKLLSEKSINHAKNFSFEKTAIETLNIIKK